MRLRLTVCAIACFLIGACGSEQSTVLADPPGEDLSVPATEDEQSIDGFWVLTSADFEGAPLSLLEPMFVEIEGDQISGNAVCNGFGGSFESGLDQTTAGCSAEDESVPDLSTIDAALIDAAAARPQIQGDQLVSHSGGFTFFYERTVDPTPEELFGILGDEDRMADSSEIFLDPEAGGSHQPFEQLVRVDHPGSTGRFFIGVSSELVCLIASTDTESLTTCHRPRFAARTAGGYELSNRNGPTGIRMALIPDPFVDAAAQRPDLGEVYDNILLIDDDATPGRHTLTDAGGAQLVVQIPQ